MLSFTQTFFIAENIFLLLGFIYFAKDALLKYFRTEKDRVPNIFFSEYCSEISRRPQDLQEDTYVEELRSPASFNQQWAGMGAGVPLSLHGLPLSPAAEGHCYSILVVCQAFDLINGKFAAKADSS